MITWTFNGMVIFQGNETTGGNFTLTISSDDYGSYTCTSSNEFGSNNSTVEVIRAGMILASSPGRFYFFFSNNY